MTSETVRQIKTRVAQLTSRDTRSVRLVRRDFTASLKAEPPKVVVDIALQLIQQGEFLLRFIGNELVHYHRAALASLNDKTVEQLGRGMDCWEAVDTFASYLSGPCWREKQVKDKTIVRWTKSNDRWWRRAALVSTVPLNNRTRGGHGDADRTLSICQLLLDDRDDMVVKAMSWALRELAKRDAMAASSFLKRHEARLAPRVVREVGNKLRSGLKNP